jgi:hypothetical protein
MHATILRGVNCHILLTEKCMLVSAESDGKARLHRMDLCVLNCPYIKR